MSLEKVNADPNLDLLMTIRGTETLNLDNNGKLYVENTSNKGLNPAIQGEQLQKIQTVADQALKARMSSFESGEELIQPNYNDYPSLLFRFAHYHLITEEQRYKLTIQWYEQRYNELVDFYDEPIFAEAHVTSEMALDPCILEHDKAYRYKIYPEPVQTGYSGSYFLKNRKGEIIGIFKPKQQEYGQKLNPKGHTKATGPQTLGHVNGTSWLKEIAAYELDIDGDMGVPKTTEMTLNFITKQELEIQEGSFQVFINKGADLKGFKDEQIKNIPVFEVQKIALFDLLINNRDRNLGNILHLQDGDNQTLVPVDHGLAFLNAINIDGAWLHCAQIKQPLDNRLKLWLKNFDIKKSVKKLQLLGISKEAIFVHQVLHAFLLVAVEKNMPIKEIASYCTRNLQDECLLEKIVNQILESMQKKEKGKEVDQDKFFERFNKFLEANL